MFYKNKLDSLGLILGLAKIGSAQNDCLVPQLSMKNINIDHWKGTKIGTVDVKTHSVLEFNLTWGTGSTWRPNNLRSLIHIGNSEKRRQPAVYLFEPTMRFSMAWNQDDDDFGDVVPADNLAQGGPETTSNLGEHIGIQGVGDPGSIDNFRIETANNVVTFYINGVQIEALTIVPTPQIEEEPQQDIMWGSNYINPPNEYFNVDCHLLGIEYSTYEPNQDGSCPTTTTTHSMTKFK